MIFLALRSNCMRTHSNINTHQIANLDPLPHRLLLASQFFFLVLFCLFPFFPIVRCLQYKESSKIDQIDIVVVDNSVNKLYIQGQLLVLILLQIWSHLHTYNTVQQRIYFLSKVLFFITYRFVHMYSIIIHIMPFNAWKIAQVV